MLALLLCLPLLAQSSPYMLVLGIDVLIAVLFAASLHFIMGPGGMDSFGHAAYFGLGAYAAALLVKWLSVPMELALAAGAARRARRRAAVRLVLRAAVRRLSRDADARLRADRLVGGVPVGCTDRRLQRPGRRLAAAAVRQGWVYFLLTLALAVIAVLLLRRFLFAPFGYALRAGRDSPLRAEAIGIDVKRVQWLGFALAGAVCGLAGGLYAFSKGTISPETLGVRRSVDGLVMVLLGGIQTLTGPIVGAAVFTWLQDTVMRQTDYWRALLGGIILLLVLAFPQGIVGGFAALWRKTRGQVMSVLEVRSLSKSFGGVRAVSDVSFAVAAGELLAMIGPNGAGKTTCFNMVNGQLRRIRRDPVRRARTSPGLRRARSGGSASAAPSRSPPRSAR